MHPVTFRNPFGTTSQPPHTVAIIPARYQSTRFPGKPLADIAGKPMIEHVYRRASSAPGVDAVVVATDDARIALTVERFGGIVRMTRSIHRTGTDRIAEIAAEIDCEVIVNVQGDLPLLDPDMVEQVVRPLFSDQNVQMATVRRRITDPGDYTNPNVVKVVTDANGDALYFSRSPLPFVRGSIFEAAGLTLPAYKHIGLYAYRRDFLLTITKLPQTPLEVAESLEQLRVLEHGFRIRTVETQVESVEVDTPEDIERVRRLMAVETRA